MNDETSQEDVLSEFNYIRITIVLNPEYVDFLKTIDKNASGAVRKLIKNYMKQKRLLSFEKYLTSFAFGLALIGIGTILPNLYISLTSMGTGLFCIIFSLAMYSHSRIRYEKGE